MDSKTKQLSGKNLALKTKILAIIVVVSSLIAKFIFKADWISIGEVLSVGGFIVAAFGDISISKWLEKKNRGI